MGGHRLEGLEGPEQRRGVTFNGDGLGDRDFTTAVAARTGLEGGTDSKSLSLECVELAGRVGGEHHAHTAMAGGETSILRTVDPDGVLVLDSDVEGGEVRVLARGNGVAV